MSSSPSIVRLSRRNLLLAATVLSASGMAMRRIGSVAAVAPADTYAPFLDPTILHAIDTTIVPTEYEAMLASFAATGSKDWITATVVINGEQFENVGMRLKGNSSLGGARMMDQVDGPQVSTPTSSTNGGPATDTQDEFPGGGNLADRDPETLPWLIRLDRTVEDQNYNGITQIVIRSNNSQNISNEAVALNLLDKAGLASQQAAYTAFTVNESDPALRLAIEHPKDAWLKARFDKDGYLYKAEATGDYSYRGTDPATYTDVFELEAGGTGDDSADLDPLIDFLDFISNASDDDFEAKIADRVDLDQFATYLAMMDLINNMDAIDGPGNNSYLYVGPDSEQFTVVPWDMNLAFGGMGGQFRPGDDTNGGPFPGGDIPTNADGTPIVPGDGPLPVPGGTNPEGTPVAGGVIINNRPDGGGIVQGGPGGGMGGRANILVTRAKAQDSFAEQVESETTQLRSDLFDSGEARSILDTWTAFLKANAIALVTAEIIAEEATSIATFIQE